MPDTCIEVNDNKVMAKGQSDMTDETLAECDTPEQAKRVLSELKGSLTEYGKLWYIEAIIVNKLC